MFPILVTTERACAELVASASVSASLNVNVYTGIDTDTKSAPAVVCSATDAEEEFVDSGVWHVKTNIIVKEIAADSNITSSIANVVFERFSRNNIKYDLTNSVSNYSVYAVIPSGVTNDVSDDAWVQTLSFDIVCVIT